MKVCISQVAHDPWCAVLPNLSVNTDAQVRPPASPALSLGAGYLRRYVAWR